MTVDHVGFAACLITVVYTVIGLPAQIRANFQRKSVEGISLFMNVVLIFAFISWVYYGLLKRDWYIVGSNAPGALCIAVILTQFYLYRGRNARFGSSQYYEGDPPAFSRQAEARRTSK